MSYFEKINSDKAKSVANILLESPFFYRTDDEDLFLFLRRHRKSFESLFEDCFGFDLMVDNRCARLYKSTWHNRALTPSKHDVFDLTRRESCIAFLIVLQFYEHLLDEQNLAIDDPELPCFYYGDLFEFAMARYAEVLGEGAPTATETKRTLRELMTVLLRYRFIHEVPPDRDDLDVDRENLLYQCLPGLYCYDVRRLGATALSDVLSAGANQEGPR